MGSSAESCALVRAHHQRIGIFPGVETLFVPAKYGPSVSPAESARIFGDGLFRTDRE